MSFAIDNEFIQGLERQRSA